MFTEDSNTNYYNGVSIDEIIEKLVQLDNLNEIYDIYTFDDKEDFFKVVNLYKKAHALDNQNFPIKVKDVRVEENGEDSVIVFEEISPLLMAILIEHGRSCLKEDTTDVAALLEVGLGTILEEYISKHSIQDDEGDEQQ